MNLEDSAFCPEIFIEAYLPSWSDYDYDVDQLLDESLISPIVDIVDVLTLRTSDNVRYS